MDVEVNEYRAVNVHCLGEAGFQFICVIRVKSLNVHALGKLNKIRCVKFRFVKASLKLVVLKTTQYAVTAIVKDDDHNRCFVLCRCCEFPHVEHETAVTMHDDCLLTRRNRNANT